MSLSQALNQFAQNLGRYPLADTGKYDEQGMMGSGDWYGITTGAVK